ncbi:MAG: protein kinase [Myxococcales bacterium]|nr:protein kinase [Myxococcales bacterium]
MRQPVKFGKYLLLGRISVGGMAEVFKAKSFGEEGFEKIIAIKRILPALGRDEDFITMFIDEAKIAGQLAHANVGQIHELGQVDGAYFIAMEYIWGRDLLQLQNRFKKRGRRLSRAAAGFIVMKVCEGLHYAHKKRDVLGAAMQIVHRDCSPQNVVVSFEGEVKLIDFGIARAASRSSRTNAGVLKGKFGYMSPEQVRGLPLDRRSDIFSLGIILFETLTGKRLFDGESDFSTLEKVRNVEIDHRLIEEAQVPRALQAILLKALARSADDRYQWCSEMRDDLRMYLQTIEDAYSYRSLGEEMREVFADEFNRERELMDLYSQIGPEGLPEEEQSAEHLVGVDELEQPKASDESVLDSLDFIETSSPLARQSGGGVDGFEDNPTEIFGEIEMQEMATETLEADAAVAEKPTKDNPVAPIKTVDFAELFADSYDRGISQPLIGADDGAKVMVAGEKRSSSASANALVASLPTLGGPRQTSGTAQVHRSAITGPGSSGQHSVAAMTQSTGEMLPIGEAAKPGLPATGVRARPGRQSGRRSVLVGVSVAAVAVLVLLAIRGMFFATGSAGNGPAPRATLLVLVGDKEGADVFLGAEKVGAVPPGDALTVNKLAPGTYDIRVERKGASGCKETIAVSAEKPKVFSCDFAAAEQGRLLIEDLRDGDRVVIDGKTAITSDVSEPISLVAGRSHMIAITRDGKLVDEFEVTLEADKEVRHEMIREEIALDAGVEELVMQPDDISAKEPKTKSRDWANSESSKSLLGDEPDKSRNRRGGNESKPTTKKPAFVVDITDDEPPSQKATGPGYLVPWTRPWARVHVDGKDTGKITPVAPSAKIPLSPGPHRVTFVVGETKHHFQVKIESGKTTKLTKILEP